MPRVLSVFRQARPDAKLTRAGQGGAMDHTRSSVPPPLRALARSRQSAHAVAAFGKGQTPMSERTEKPLTLRLYGPPQVRLRGQGSIAGTRAIALCAVLAMAPEARRSRNWLVATLWSSGTETRGRANLRQLLHALRQTMGAAFEAIFEISREDIALRPGAFEVRGGPGDGVFLEGIDLPEEGFEDWLRTTRQAAPDTGPGAHTWAITEPETATEILPRIMVVPFAELATPLGLGDAVAQELTSHFARSQLIDAISHFTCRAFLTGGDGMAGVADYALTGQLRGQGERVWVDTSLVQLSSQKVIWSDRIDLSLPAFLAGDDGATRQIAGQVLSVICARAIGETATRPLQELEAHTLLVAAVALMHSFERRHFDLAEGQLAEVIRRCPEHSVPRAWLAQWHLLRIYQKWTADAAKDQIRAANAVKAALDLNPACPLSLAIDGNILTVLARDPARARQRFDAAMAINPSSGFISQLGAVMETFAGQGDAAVRLTDRAYRLSPRDPRRPFFQTLSAGSYIAGGRYLEAVEMAESSLRHHPLHLSAHRCRVIGLHLAGRAPEAAKAARELLRLDPDLTASAYRRAHPAGDTEMVRLWADALQGAGVPA